MRRKIRLKHAQTGEAVERWPVDAREMIASGDWVAEDPMFQQKVVGIGSGGYEAPKLPHVAAAEAAVAQSPHNLVNAEPEKGKAAPAIPEEETEASPKKRGKK